MFVVNFSDLSPRIFMEKDVRILSGGYYFTRPWEQQAMVF
jgi:hypothetical protein